MNCELYDTGFISNKNSKYSSPVARLNFLNKQMLLSPPTFKYSYLMTQLPLSYITYHSNRRWRLCHRSQKFLLERVSGKILEKNRNFFLFNEWTTIYYHLSYSFIFSYHRCHPSSFIRVFFTLIFFLTFFLRRFE